MYELYDPCSLMFFFRNKVRATLRSWGCLPPLSWWNMRCVAPACRPPLSSMGTLTGCGLALTAHEQHIMIDLGTGNNNKINWAFSEKQELIDIIEVVYRCVRGCQLPEWRCCNGADRAWGTSFVCRGGRKGRGLVVSPKDYSTKYRY